jgi:hypothetical protein
MVYLLTLVYGSESWTMLTKYESRIRGAVICMRKTGRDRIINRQI